MRLLSPRIIPIGAQYLYPAAAPPAGARARAPKIIRMRTAAIGVGHHDEEDKVVGIHWRLLMSVTRRENRRDWKKMATRVRKYFPYDVINRIF